MKKKIFLLPCIAAVAIATFVGAKSFKTSAYESNDLLMQNVEALTQSTNSGEVPNGKVLKVNPMHKKNCWTHKVDKNDFRIERTLDESGQVIEIKLYKHYWDKYVSEACELMSIDNSPKWYKLCYTPKEAKCNYGDATEEPSPLVEYY